MGKYVLCEEVYECEHNSQGFCDEEYMCGCESCRYYVKKYKPVDND